jgi:hypothetical protein
MARCSAEKNEDTGLLSPSLSASSSLLERGSAWYLSRVTERGIKVQGKRYTLWVIHLLMQPCNLRGEARSQEYGTELEMTAAGLTLTPWPRLILLNKHSALIYWVVWVYILTLFCISNNTETELACKRALLALYCRKKRWNLGARYHIS